MLVSILNALLGTALGLSLSALATNEFQAVELMPTALLPQVLLCGIIEPRDALPTALRGISDVMPMSYSVDATDRVATTTGISAALANDLAVVAGFIVASLVVGVLTLRRRTP